jgi:LmbE family N-acetylglucosaminyl deacetylase
LSLCVFDVSFSFEVRSKSERGSVVSEPRLNLSLTSISAQFGRVVVVSPHMDDAILSCGGLLSRLLPVIDCLTVTVCTADPAGVNSDHPPHGIALPSLRRNEEVRALRALGCPLMQLDLLDAIYRENTHTKSPLYPTMQSLWTMPVDADSVHRQELRNRLLPISKPVGDRPTLFVTPMGIGHHVDHILCTQVVLSIVSSTDHVLLYEDFPYVVDQGAHVGLADNAQNALRRLNVRGVECLTQECDLESKVSWISCYESQIDSIFGSAEHVRPMLMKNSMNGHTVERFWKIQKI